MRQVLLSQARLLSPIEDIRLVLLGTGNRRAIRRDDGKSVNRRIL